LCSRLTIGITDRDFAAVIESGAGNENISMLSNFEQTLDCQCRHDMYEQTSGEGCSANVSTRKRFGAFCFGKKAYNRVSPNLLWHHGDALTFQEMCDFDQTLNTGMV
jgi:hypothetical protein